MTRFISSSLAEVIGWTFLHFLWQGAAIAVSVAFIAFLLPKRAIWQYYLHLLGLGIVTLAPIVTFTVLWTSSTSEILTLPESISPALTSLETPPWERLLSEATPYLALLWIAGALFFQVRLSSQLYCVRKLRTSDVSPVSTHCHTLMVEMKRRIGISRSVCIVESTRARVPMVVGWMKPTILLPAYAITGLTPAQLGAILAHELAHLRRYDDVINLAQTFIEGLLFYHPAVWWLAARIRQEREYCCDDVAVSVCRDPMVFARALASLDDASHRKSRPAVAATGGQLMQRIRRLMKMERTRPRRFAVASLPIMGALVVLTVAAQGFASNDVPTNEESWVARGEETTLPLIGSLFDDKGDSEKQLIKLLQSQGFKKAEIAELFKKRAKRLKQDDETLRRLDVDAARSEREADLEKRRAAVQEIENERVAEFYADEVKTRSLEEELVRREVQLRDAQNRLEEMERHLHQLQSDRRLSPPKGDEQWRRKVEDEKALEAVDRMRALERNLQQRVRDESAVQAQKQELENALLDAKRLHQESSSDAKASFIEKLNALERLQSQQDTKSLYLKQRQAEIELRQAQEFAEKKHADLARKEATDYEIVLRTKKADLERLHADALIKNQYRRAQLQEQKALIEAQKSLEVESAEGERLRLDRLQRKMSPEGEGKVDFVRLEAHENALRFLEEAAKLDPENADVKLEALREKRLLKETRKQEKNTKAKKRRIF